MKNNCSIYYILNTEWDIYVYVAHLLQRWRNLENEVPENEFKFFQLLMFRDII